MSYPTLWNFTVVTTSDPSDSNVVANYRKIIGFRFISLQQVSITFWTIQAKYLRFMQKTNQNIRQLRNNWGLIVEKNFGAGGTGKVPYVLT